jgi:hypothetical protein
MNYLNIGLAVNDCKPNTIEETVSIVCVAGVELCAVELQESDTEETLVISTYTPVTEQQLHEIATKLNQEAVAYYCGKTSKGILVGPNAHAWGDFNLDRFLFNTTYGLET